MNDTDNKTIQPIDSKRKKALRLAAAVALTSAVAVPAFADTSVSGNITCPDGNTYAYSFTCSSDGMPYEYCACQSWSSTGGYSDCVMHVGCC